MKTADYFPEEKKHHDLIVEVLQRIPETDPLRKALMESTDEVLTQHHFKQLLLEKVRDILGISGTNQSTVEILRDLKQRASGVFHGGC